MEEYKKTTEWQALNKIYQSLPNNLKEKNIDNFKVLSNFLKKSETLQNISKLSKNKQLVNMQYKYLSSLSVETQELILNLIDEGEKNLYHSIMAIIGYSNTFRSVNEVWEYYSEKYGAERPYIIFYQENIKEIIAYCLKKLTDEGKMIK